MKHLPSAPTNTPTIPGCRIKQWKNTSATFHIHLITCHNGHTYSACTSATSLACLWSGSPNKNISSQVLHNNKKSTTERPSVWTGGWWWLCLQILNFPAGQIFPQLGPHNVNWIQISDTRWESHPCQAMLVVLTVNSQERFIITPHLQPLDASTLVNNKFLASQF